METNEEPPIDDSDAFLSEDGGTIPSDNNNYADLPEYVAVNYEFTPDSDEEEEEESSQPMSSEPSHKDFPVMVVTYEEKEMLASPNGPMPMAESPFAVTPAANPATISPQVTPVALPSFSCSDTSPESGGPMPMIGQRSLEDESSVFVGWHQESQHITLGASGRMLKRTESALMCNARDSPILQPRKSKRWKGRMRRCSGISRLPQHAAFCRVGESLPDPASFGMGNENARPQLRNRTMSMSAGFLVKQPAPCTEIFDEKDQSGAETSEYEDSSEEEEEEEEAFHFKSGKHQPLLPVIPRRRCKARQQELKFVSCRTVAKLVRGEFKHVTKLYIVDARFKFEWVGGHIQHSLNCGNEKALHDAIDIPKEGERVVLIFHCEYSSKRGPGLCSRFRNLDRTLHFNSYPHLDFPDIYVMEGGYRKFWSRYPDLCTPRGYVPETSELHQDQQHAEKRERRHIRLRRAQSWSGRPLVLKRKGDTEEMRWTMEDPWKE